MTEPGSIILNCLHYQRGIFNQDILSLQGPRAPPKGEKFYRLWFMGATVISLNYQLEGDSARLQTFIFIVRYVLSV
jgi:hypothetical protein